MENDYKYLPFEVDKVRYAVSMEYVAYIVSTSDPFPHCTPPKRNRYIDRIISIEKKLITVVELTGLRKNDSRPFILILSYQDSMIGLLTDSIASPLECSELKLEKDSTVQHTFLTCDKEELVLFDVPEFYKKMTTSGVARVIEDTRG